MGNSVIVHLSGIDGSGKSTIASILEEKLEAIGLPVARIWIRFPYIFSIPFLIIMKLLGYSVKYHYENVSFTVHNFERFRRIFKLLFFIDFHIMYFLKVKLRSVIPVVLIVDRGPIDNLVDLLSDVSGHPSETPLLVKVFCHLQRKDIYIGLRADREILMKRRIQNKYDQKFSIRLEYYDFLFTRCPPHPLIDTGKRNLMEVRKELEMKIIPQIRKKYGPIGYGKLFSNKILRGIFSNKFVILLTNWLIQGSLIADWSENIIRLSIDASAFIFTYIVTKSILWSLIFVIAAHTLNHLINSNSTNLIRYFRTVDHKRNLELILSEIKQHNLAHIEGIVIFGSYARREAGNRSDIDLRIVKSRGLVSLLHSLVLLYKLRIFALKKGIPLDIFVHSTRKLCKIINYNEIDSMIILPPSKKKELIKICKEISQLT